MLSANQQLIALGKTVKGQPKQFKYILTNTSDKPVVINEILVGCGSCTVASTEKTTIEPGGTTTINASFNGNSTGLQVKSIFVKYGNNKETLTLKFSAEVI